MQIVPEIGVQFACSEQTGCLHTQLHVQGQA